MTVTDDMRTILANDTTFAGLVPGGVLADPLTTTGPMWTADPITGVKTLVVTAVLLEPQEVAAPFGLNPGRRLDLWQEPELYVYGPQDALDTLYAADERAMELLHGQRLGLADVTATPYRARPLVADELPGTILNIFRRYRITTARHISEA